MEYLVQTPLWPVVGVLVFVLGACLGSFVNCWAYRSAKGQSVLNGRSACPSCGHVLGARDLVPIVSWLLARGRCRHCKAAVSARYPITELLCGMGLLSVWLKWGPSAQFAELSVFLCALLFLSLVDLDTFTIPNAALIVALVARVAYLVWLGAFGLGLGGGAGAGGQAAATAGTTSAGLAAALSAGAGLPAVGALLGEALFGGLALAVPVLVLVLVADRVFGRESMGGGDIKLFFVAGAYFGWQQGLFLILAACIIGIVWALASQLADARAERDQADTEARIARAKRQLDEDGGPATLYGADSEGAQSREFLRRRIPFGPSIALACWVTMLIGAEVISAYLGLFLV